MPVGAPKLYPLSQARAKASSIVGRTLVPNYVEGSNGPGGWWILDEPELHLGPNIRVPDIAGWRRERLPETAWLELPPDWVCEVLSPSIERTDRADKLPIYAEFGVAFAWLVDPDARNLEVYALSDGLWRLEHVYNDEDQVCAQPFDALTFALDALWA